MKNIRIIGLILGAFASVFANSPFDRRIQILNATEKKIAKVSVSSDGENYTAVNLAHGIKPRQTVQINWQRRDSDCYWTLKAQYADRSESGPQRINVCEQDVTVEFR